MSAYCNKSRQPDASFPRRRSYACTGATALFDPSPQPVLSGVAIGPFNGVQRGIGLPGISDYAKTLTKGSHLAIEGELRSREREDKKTGAKQRVWEMRVTSILKLDRAEKAAPEEAENTEFNPEEEVA